MTIAFVQTKGRYLYSTTNPVTLDATTTAGNTIVVNVGHYNVATGLTVTDNGGNTYVKLGQLDAAAGGAANSYGAMWACVDANAASVVTVGTAAGSVPWLVQVTEFSGVTSVGTVNKYAGTNASLAATNSSGDLVMAMMCGYSTTPASIGQTGTGYTFLTALNHAASNAYVLRGGYQVAGTANIDGPSWSPIGGHGLITASFVGTGPITGTPTGSGPLWKIDATGLTGGAGALTHSISPTTGVVETSEGVFWVPQGSSAVDYTVTSTDGVSPVTNDVTVPAAGVDGIRRRRWTGTDWS